MSLFRKPPPPFEFPGPTDRCTVVGGTGSGKSVFAQWCIAESADFDQKPWTMIDYKGDEIIDALIAKELATVIKLDARLPTKPGLYVVKPHPKSQHEFADWLWKVYDRGRMGLFFDELSMVPDFRGVGNSGGPLESIYTQGRSKKIPIYGCVQRPVKVNGQVFAQAQYICAFNVAKLDDRKTLSEYIPDEVSLFNPRGPALRDHWSRWWDDRRKVAMLLRPVPPPKAILGLFEQRVGRMKEIEQV